MAAHLGHRRRGGVEIGADEIAPLLGVELRRNAGRADQIAEHHREIAPLADRFRNLRRWGRRRTTRGRGRRWRGGSRAVPGSERPQDLAAMTEQDSELFQILIRQIGEYAEVYRVLSEALRVLGHTELFEPVCYFLVGGHRLPR